MSFSHQSIYGTTYGNLTPEEELRAQTAARASSAAAAADSAAYLQRQSTEADRRAKEAAAGPFGNGDPFASSGDTPEGAVKQVLKQALGGGAAPAGGGGDAPPPRPSPAPAGGYGEYGTEQYFNNRAIGRSAKDVQLGKDQETLAEQRRKQAAEDELMAVAGLSTAVGRSGPQGMGDGGGYIADVLPDGTTQNRHYIQGDLSPGNPADRPDDAPGAVGAAAPAPAGGGASAGGNGLDEDKIYKRALLSWIAGGKQGTAPDLFAIHKQVLQAKLEDLQNAAQTKKPAAGTVAPDDQQELDAAVASGKSLSEAANALAQKHEYAAIAPQVKELMDGLGKFMDSPTFFRLSKNKAELSRLYNGVLQRIVALGATPKAQNLLVQDMKNLIQAGISKNAGSFVNDFNPDEIEEFRKTYK